MPDELIPDAAGLLIDGLTDPQHFAEIGESIVHHYLIGKMRLQPDESVLDIGSGYGKAARPLARYLSIKGSYTGFDVVRAGITWCADRYARFPNIQFHHADILSSWYNRTGAQSSEEYVFPYLDQSFHVAIMSSLATHILPLGLQNYFAQTYRVLKPGGRLYASAFLINSANCEVVFSPTPEMPLKFHHVDERYAVLDHASPEMGIAYSETFFRRALHKAGFLIVELNFGTWVNRIDIVGALQDVVIAIKPPPHHPIFAVQRQARPMNAPG